MPPDPTLPLAQAGQRFRTEGLSLDIGRVRRAIYAGQIPAVRDGGRWRVREEDARAFTRPLEAPAAYDPADRP